MSKILIADDDQITRHLLRTLLTENGWDVVAEACDGEAVLPLCERFAPDVVCLDIEMPGKNGLDVLRQLRSRFPEVAVVVISVSAASADIRGALSEGAVGFIIKPFKAKVVLETIGKFGVAAGSDRQLTGYAS